MRKQIIENILTDYNKKRLRAAYHADKRRDELYVKIPRLEKIDTEIKLLSIKLSKIFLSNSNDKSEQTLMLKNEIDNLKNEKTQLYKKYNIPDSFLNITYECGQCNDTGYTEDGKKCKCYNIQLIDSLYKMSNMVNILKRENFSTFDISIFSNDHYNNEKLTPKQNMYKVLETCEDFCINFDRFNMNLLFYGGTGLGKTFMCNCIAKALLDVEKSVLYKTAYNLFELVEGHKFNKQNTTEEEKIDYSMIFECELLIIDDLGTEFNNSFTNSELFNIINERLINEKKTIISTNLSLEQLAESYSDRIMSRVFNNFVPLKFYGKDLRWETK